MPCRYSIKLGQIRLDVVVFLNQRSHLKVTCINLKALHARISPPNLVENGWVAFKKLKITMVHECMMDTGSQNTFTWTSARWAKIFLIIYLNLMKQVHNEMLLSAVCIFIQMTEVNTLSPSKTV